MNTKYLIASMLAILAFFGLLTGLHMIKLPGKPQLVAEAITAGEKDIDHEAIPFTCGMHPFVLQNEPGNCPICGMVLTPMKTTGSDRSSGEQKIKYWVDPQDPSNISDKPGSSPNGRELMPVYEDEAVEGIVVTVDPVTIQKMGIRTSSVTRRDMQRTISTVGLVDYDENTQYSVNSKIDGWVELLHVSRTGQKISKGAPLLEIYSPELVTAQEEYLLALAGYEVARGSTVTGLAESSKRLLDAGRRRLQLWDISSNDISELEQNHKVRKTMTLYAPYGGIVTMKSANEGQFVKSGMELFKIADMSTIWVYADLYENELPWVQEGLDAEIILPYAGQKNIAATVSYIYPYVEPKTRTIKARLDIKNSDFNLKPDMFVNVRIKSKTVLQTLVVPAEAVLYSGDKNTVFVAMKGGRFEPRRVKLGLRDDQGHIEIVQGLFEGESIVTSAQFMLDSESKLQEAIQKMLNPTRISPEQEKDYPEDLFIEAAAGKSKKQTVDDLFN